MNSEDKSTDYVIIEEPPRKNKTGLICCGGRTRLLRVCFRTGRVQVLAYKYPPCKDTISVFTVSKPTVRRIAPATPKKPEGDSE